MDSRSHLAEQVIEFVAKELGFPKEDLTLDTTMFGDLCVDGDDGIEFFEQFSSEFGVDMSKMEISRHFGAEGGNSVVCSYFPLRLIFRWFKWNRHAVFRKEPIRLGDLVRAAEVGHWDYPEKPECTGADAAR